MAKIIDKIKKDILEQVLSQDELENIMAEYKYHPVEIDDYDKEDDVEILKFTNYSSQIWLDVERDDEQSILITKVRRVNRTEYESTRSEPFRSYEDLEKIMNYFKDNGYYNHWITGWLMTSLGRRIGDTVALKWLDIFKENGKYRERLTQLREEKTHKKLAPRLNALAKLRIDEYIDIVGINPMEHYSEQIVNTSDAAFRKQLRKAIESIKIEGKISPHSFRKFYANTIYRLHPQDADNLMIVQSILGHSDAETTKIYIGEIDRKIDKYNEDYANYMIARNEGINIDISNSPIMALKADEFRELLSKCWDMAASGENKFEGINKLIGMAEKLMI